MLYSTIYVDSAYGNDTWDGSITSPVQTLTYAISNAPEGAVVVLQNGDSTPYDPLGIPITKNLMLKSAYGARAKVKSIAVTKAQCAFEGLHFDTLPTGITVVNDPFGAVSITDCLFDDVATAIDLTNVNYVSILRNTINGHTYGVKINSAIEVAISNNVFFNGFRSIEVNTVDRLDTWRNTIFGAGSAGPVPSPDTDARVLYRTLSASNISNRKIQLPSFASANDYGYDVAVNIVNGPSFAYDTDYTVVTPGSIISWSGLGLESQLAVGDVIRIIYSEAGAPISSSEAVKIFGVLDSNSRVDSNNIVGTLIPDVNLGIYFSTPIKIRHNNFYNTFTGYQGATPSSETGNFSLDPAFVSPGLPDNDYRLQSTSPNINNGDPVRWTEIYSEMGIQNIGGWTSVGVPTRNNVTPFGRDIDAAGVNRYVVGFTGDVGAYEYNQNDGSTGQYVAEDGYDYTYPGTETGPYATLDRGYDRVGLNTLHIKTNPMPMDIGAGYTGTNGMGYGRYTSKNLVLSGGDMTTDGTDRDTVFIFATHPSYETGAVYASPDGDDSYTGTFDSPFRTIGRALQEPVTAVIVLPGIYPRFIGETGKKVIGVRSTSAVNFGTQILLGYTGASWTGVETGAFNIYSTSMQTTNETDVLSTFQVTPDLTLKESVYLTCAKHKTEIRNGTDILDVILDRDNLKAYIAYSIGATGYTYTYGFTGADDKTYLYIDVVGSKGTVKISNDYLHYSLGFNMYTGYADPYSINFVSYGTGMCYIRDFSVASDNFSGFTGAISTQTSKKVFGILNATGING